MKINLRSITVMLGLLAIVSIMIPTQMMQMQSFASTQDEEKENIAIQEQGDDDNDADMRLMTVKEGNNKPEKVDGFMLGPDNLLFVEVGTNVEVTEDLESGQSFYRALITDTKDKSTQYPINSQGVVSLKGGNVQAEGETKRVPQLKQGAYTLDVVIREGQKKIAYEIGLFIGPDNDQNRQTINKEIDRSNTEKIITTKIIKHDRTGSECGKGTFFNEKTRKCEVKQKPPVCTPPAKFNPTTKKCEPPKPPTKTPTPPITGPGGEKPTCLSNGKPGRISSNAQTCTPFDGSPPTRIRGPIDVIVPIPGTPCIEGQTPERNNCVATTPPGTQFPQCITPGNPPNCVPGPDTKPGATVGTACMTVDGKPGRVAPNGACTASGAPLTPTPPPTRVPGSGPGAVTPSCTTPDGKPGMMGSSPDGPTCTPITGQPGTTPTPTPTSPQGAPAGLAPGSTDVQGGPCTLPDGLPGTIKGSVGDMTCEPTGVGGATTAPTGPVGSDCALPGGGTGGKVMNTNNGIACVGTPTPRDALPIEPIRPDAPIAALTPTPTPTPPTDEPTAPTDPTELANFCADNTQHSACQTPTTPPDTTGEVPGVPEPQVPDTPPTVDECEAAQNQLPGCEEVNPPETETPTPTGPITEPGRTDGTQGAPVSPDDGQQGPIPDPTPAPTPDPNVPPGPPPDETQQPSTTAQDAQDDALFGGTEDDQTTTGTEGTTERTPGQTFAGPGAPQDDCDLFRNTPECPPQVPEPGDPPTPTEPTEPTTTPPPEVTPTPTPPPEENGAGLLPGQEGLTAGPLADQPLADQLAADQPLNCEAQGLIEEDGECVVPDPEVDCEAQGLVEEDGECVMPSDDEADLESDESALEQSAPADEAYDLGQGEEDLGDGGEGGITDDGSSGEASSDDSSGESSDEAE